MTSRTRRASAQKAGPRLTVAMPATFTSATTTPMMKISAIAQGLSLVARRKAAFAPGAGVRPRRRGRIV
jgi:hypothetical protein